MDDYAVEDKTYTRLSFRYDESLVVPDNAAAEAEQSDENISADDSATDEQSKPESVADEAARLTANPSVRIAL